MFTKANKRKQKHRQTLISGSLKEDPKVLKKEKSAQRGSFWDGHPADIRGHSRGYPGPKVRSGRSKSWKNKHLGADIHDPKARTSTTLRDFQKLRSEKLWAEFPFPKNADERTQHEQTQTNVNKCKNQKSTRTRVQTFRGAIEAVLPLRPRTPSEPLLIRIRF